MEFTTETRRTRGQTILSVFSVVNSVLADAEAVRNGGNTAEGRRDAVSRFSVEPARLRSGEPGWMHRLRPLLWRLGGPRQGFPRVARTLLRDGLTILIGDVGEVSGSRSDKRAAVPLPEILVSEIA